MKNRLFFLSCTITLSLCIFLLTAKTDRTSVAKIERDVPFNQDSKSENNTEELLLRQHEEFIKTVDPALGYVPTEKLVNAAIQAKRIMQEQMNNPLVPPLPGLVWTERGPNNIGGRTRAIVIDKTDGSGNTVIAGSVGGGIWRTTNFLAASPTWTQAVSASQNFAISCLAQSPNSTAIKDTIYAGTGEGYGNSDAIRGLGMYRSVDGGQSWTLLASTTTGGANANDFSYIQRILVTPNGNVYAAASSAIFCNNGGVLRSQNAGSTWTRVIGTYDGLGSCSGATDFIGFDLELSSGGDLWASTQTGATAAGKVWKSPAGATLGDAGTWINVTPPPTGTQWRRIELAASSLTNNTVYALMQNGSSNAVGGMRKTIDGGTTWTNITNANNWCDQGSSTSTDFSRNQAWYDLTIAVKPNDDNTVFVGGVDYFKTSDGGTTWAQATQWSAGCGASPQIHADNHNLVYFPGSSTQFIATNDGGIYYTSDGGATFTNKNSSFNVTQYYGVAMHPTSGNNYMLAGAQDNGTHKFSTAGINTVTTATGGDGGLPFISQTNGLNQVTNFTGTSINISTNGGTSFLNQGTFSSDRFINPADLDNSTEIYYCGSSTQRFRRISNAASGTGIFTGANSVNSFVVGTATTNHSVSAIKVDPNTANRIWVAFSQASSAVAVAAPQLYIVDAANTSTPVTTSITLPVAVASNSIYISSLDVEQGNASHILLTTSNYGVQSVWQSTDMGATWASLDNNSLITPNLPDMPVRWGMFIPSGYNPGLNTLTVGGILLGTELGVWSASTLSGTSTVWTQNSGTMGNVPVYYIALRSSDKTIAAATHGRGVFTAPLIVNPVPLDFLTFKGIPLTNSNQLTWDVANEFNDASFDIERKYVNGSSFNKVGNISATNSNGRNSYSFDDRNIDLSQQQAYYRLKQIDLDGRYKYSPQLLIKRANIGKLVYYISADRNKLLIRTGNKGGVTTMGINIYDLNGKLVISEQNAYTDQYIDISRLSSGTYVLSCKSPQADEIYSAKFVK